jgi:hypothetical protein
MRVVGRSGRREPVEGGSLDAWGKEKGCRVEILLLP